MTDEDLVAALGWELCERNPQHPERGCVVHGRGGLWVQGDPWCLYLTYALAGARAGIDLARNAALDILNWHRARHSRRESDGR